MGAACRASCYAGWPDGQQTHDQLSDFCRIQHHRTGLAGRMLWCHYTASSLGRGEGMRLYVLRHGLAGDRTKWQGDDAERPLTAQGKKKMASEAKRFRELGISPDTILTSPLVRAYQSAEIVGDELDIRV